MIVRVSHHQENHTAPGAHCPRRVRHSKDSRPNHLLGTKPSGAGLAHMSVRTSTCVSVGWFVTQPYCADGCLMHSLPVTATQCRLAFLWTAPVAQRHSERGSQSPDMRVEQLDAVCAERPWRHTCDMTPGRLVLGWPFANSRPLHCMAWPRHVALALGLGLQWVADVGLGIKESMHTGAVPREKHNNGDDTASAAGPRSLAHRAQVGRGCPGPGQAGGFPQALRLSVLLPPGMNTVARG